MDRLMEAPPEDGRPPVEVIEQAAREILPITLRLDHPRCFGFIPSSPTWPGVLADFMAAGYNINACTWLIASGPSPARAGGHRLVAALARLSGERGRAFDERRVGDQRRRLGGGPEAAGHPERATVYMSNQSHSALIRAARIIGIRPECIRLVPNDGGFRLDMDALTRAVAEDRAAGIQSHRGVRQRRSEQHGGHRSARSHGGLLRGGEHLAARRPPRTAASRW